MHNCMCSLNEINKFNNNFKNETTQKLLSKTLFYDFKKSLEMYTMFFFKLFTMTG